MISPRLCESSSQYQIIQLQPNESGDSKYQSSVSEFLDDYYSKFQRELEFHLLRATCERKLTQAVDKVTKTKVELEALLSEAQGGKSEDLSYEADLLTAHIHAWRPRQSSSLQCTDFNSGETVEISIPTGLTPTQYAEKLYAKARKLRRSVKSLSSLIEEIKPQLAYLDEVKTSLDSIQVLKR